MQGMICSGMARLGRHGSALLVRAMQGTAGEARCDRARTGRAWSVLGSAGEARSALSWRDQAVQRSAGVAWLLRDLAKQSPARLGRHG